MAYRLLSWGSGSECVLRAEACPTGRVFGDLRLRLSRTLQPIDPVKREAATFWSQNRWPLAVSTQENRRTFITNAVLEMQEPRMVRLHVSSVEVGFGAVNQKQGWLKVVGSRGA